MQLRQDTIGVPSIHQKLGLGGSDPANAGRDSRALDELGVDLGETSSLHQVIGIVVAQPDDQAGLQVVDRVEPAQQQFAGPRQTPDKDKCADRQEKTKAPRPP